MLQSLWILHVELYYQIKLLELVFACILQPANLQLGGGVGGSGHMGVGPQMGGPMGPADMSTPQKDLKFQMGMGNMMVSTM